MSKTLPIAVGALIIVAAGTTGVAWYTGTQVEPLLRQQVVDGNKQLEEALAGYGATGTLEMTSFERRLFTSTAHYVMTVQSPGFNGGQPLQVDSVADIEHGPFPWSRVKQLKLLPVMVAMNVRVEGSDGLAQLFGTPQGESPVQAHAAISYSRNLESQVNILPGQWQGPQGTFKFSGMQGVQRGSLDAKKLEVDVQTDSLEFTASDPARPMTLLMQGFKFHTGGIKGASDFYLGNSSLRIDSMAATAPGKPLFKVNNLTAEGSLEELSGKLKGSGDYRFEAVSIGDKPIGSGQMRWVFDNLDIEASRNLTHFYQYVVAPQAAAASQAQVPLRLQLTPVQQAELQTNLEKLLEGRPHVELQPLGLKTATGESHLNVSLDLARPSNLDLPGELLAQQMVSKVDAQLSVAKGTIRDLVTVQGQLGGLTDPISLKRNADGAANLASTMATLQGLAKLEGENIVSSLRYEAGNVDFNGQKMTVEQFAQFLMGAVGRQ